MRANEQVLTNARLVLDDDIVHGSLVIQAVPGVLAVGVSCHLPATLLAVIRV